MVSRERISPISLGKARASKRPPAIREASFEDHSQIAALQSKYSLEAKSYQAWKHLWLNNPAYIQHQNCIPIGWVLEDQDDNIVGYLGNIPLHYEFEGRRLLASAAHAWVVDAHYRSFALLLAERYFSQKVMDLFLNATVGPLATDAFAIFHSLPVPVGGWDRSDFWITNHRGFLANWLTMKAVPLAIPLSHLLSPILFVRDTFSQRELHRQPRAGIECCSEVDDRFDIFWEKLRKANSHMLMGVRTRVVLEWHFGSALRQNSAWIVTASKGSDLTAYAIFNRYDNPRYGLRRMRLVDFQALDGTTTTLGPMLSWACQRCRCEGIDMLESIGFSTAKRNVIRESAPWERKLPCWLYFYKTRDKSLADKLTDPNVWDPSQFDGDASL